MQDLHASEQGLSVSIARSKIDQAGHGTTLGIAAPAPETTAGEESEESTLLDAGAAWTRWRDLLGSHGILDGPAWRGIDRYGRRPRTGGLHRNSVAEIIKRRARAAGLDDADLWGGHSLRRGFATEAIAAGVPERDVQRHGRWRSRVSADRWQANARPVLRRLLRRPPGSCKSGGSLRSDRAPAHCKAQWLTVAPGLPSSL